MAVPRPWEGVCVWGEIFGSALLQPARSVCVSLSAFSLHLCPCMCVENWGNGKRIVVILGFEKVHEQVRHSMCIAAHCGEKLLIISEVMFSLWLFVCLFVSGRVSKHWSRDELINFYFCSFLNITIHCTAASMQCNNNNQDDIYGAVIMTSRSLREFTWFTWWK